MEVIDALGDKYLSKTNGIELKKTTEKLEKLESENKDALNRVQLCLDNTLDYSSNNHSSSSAKTLEQSRVEIKTDDRTFVDQFKNKQKRQRTSPSYLEKQYQSTPYAKSSTTYSELKTIGKDLWPYGDSSNVFL